jgi:hypothetical protein
MAITERSADHPNATGERGAPYSPVMAMAAEHGCGTRRWSLIRVAVLLLLVLTTSQCARHDHAAPTASGIDFRGDFETSDARQFSALECPHPSRQFKIVTSPVRQGQYAARIEVAPGDTWSNGSIRCMLANYDSDEQSGDDYYFAFSIYFPYTPSDNTVWELHSRSDLYSIDPDTSVTPHALITEQGSLQYRLLTGPASWDGSTWTGWSHYEPNISLLRNIPVRCWIDIVIHIKFAHSSRGTLEVWNRVGNGRWTDKPQVSRHDIPTLQWIPGFEHEVFGHPNDPRIPSDIYTSSLYVEMGLYPGTDSIERTTVVYLDGYRRGTSLRSVMPEFP